MKPAIPSSLTQRLNQAIKNSQLETRSVYGSKLALLKQEGIDQLNLNAVEINQFWQTMPYWAFAWACGQAMVEFMQANPEFVKNKRVLDLGTGSGLVAITAARLGAKQAYVSDLDPYAHKAAHFNAKLNQQTLIDWHQEPVDILLSSDLLYDISSHLDLQALVTNTSETLMAETLKALNLNDSSYQNFDLIHQTSSTTTPRITGFDEALRVGIFYNKQK